MSTRGAEAHLRNAKRFALAYVGADCMPPAWMNEEQREAFFTLYNAWQERRKDLALSSLIDWAYAQEKK